MQTGNTWEIWGEIWDENLGKKSGGTKKLGKTWENLGHGKTWDGPLDGVIPKARAFTSGPRDLPCGCPTLPAPFAGGWDR